jgi:hypothetical protein
VPHRYEVVAFNRLGNERKHPYTSEEALEPGAVIRLGADIEGDHDKIEEWDFRDGRVLASVGTFDDEADPDSGHGWMGRLVDVSALAGAGLQRVRKAELQP